MKYYLFIDETGDHSLSNIDENFPIFLIGGVLISEEEYLLLQNKMNNFKVKFFNTTNIILHSRDIRKINPPFQVLFDLEVKKQFYEKLNQIIVNTDFTIIPVAIMKEEHIKRYGRTADNPYTIALSFLLERVIYDCDALGNCDEVEIIIEKRGKREDSELFSVYQKIMSRGTWYVRAERFTKLFSSICFKDKKDNDIGLQLSDLVSYPIARKMLDEDLNNPAFELIKNKIRENGWKKFP